MANSFVSLPLRSNIRDDRGFVRLQYRSARGNFAGLTPIEREANTPFTPGGPSLGPSAGRDGNDLTGEITTDRIRAGKRNFAAHLGQQFPDFTSGLNVNNFLKRQILQGDLAGGDAPPLAFGNDQTLSHRYSGVTYRASPGGAQIDGRFSNIRRLGDQVRDQNFGNPGLAESAYESGVQRFNPNFNEVSGVSPIPGRNLAGNNDTSLIYATNVYEEYAQVHDVLSLPQLLSDDNFNRALFRFNDGSPQIALLQNWLISLHVTPKTRGVDGGPGGSFKSRRLYRRIYDAAINYDEPAFDTAFTRRGQNFNLPAPVVPRSTIPREAGVDNVATTDMDNNVYFQLSLQFNDDNRHYYHLHRDQQQNANPANPRLYAGGARYRTLNRFQGQAMTEGGIIYTSGAFRPFRSHHDWTAAWLSLYANLREFYANEGEGGFAGLFDFMANRRGYSAFRQRDHITTHFINVPNFQNVHLILRFVKPPEFRCFREPVTESEKNINKFLKSKQSVIFMKNTDDLCFFRSLAILFSRSMDNVRTNNSTVLTDWHKSTLSALYPNWGKQFDACRKHYKIQKVLALKLQEYCGIVETPSVSNFELIATKLRICIRILNGRNKFKLLYAVGKDYPTTVYMVAINEHLHPCWSFKGLLHYSYECIPCNSLYSNKHEHTRCPRSCFYCRKKDCVSAFTPNTDKIWKFCPECRRKFPTEECFKQHLQLSGARKPISTCQTVISCGSFSCPTFRPDDYEDLSEHSCLHRRCRNCRKMVLLKLHQCNITKKKAKKQPSAYYFFDFECTQETGTHIVTHAVVQDEGGETTLFQPKDDGNFENVCNDFCEWVVGFGAHEGATFIAHNGQGYDFHFIMKWALEHQQTPEQVIRVGQKIKHMLICGVRFLDSLSFLMMPLAAFPKTFDLAELTKGYFPHLFNTSENQNYVGPLPPKDAYMPTSMNPKALEKFEAWYAQELAEDKIFNFREEILKYCISDVDILRRGCLTFSNLYQQVTGVYPFAYITIASACMAVYRSKFLVEGDIRVLDPEHEAWIRQGFYGGRTNVMRVHVDHSELPLGEENKSIKYVDVTSLYPWVNATKDYPMGEYVYNDYTDAPKLDGDEIAEILCNVFGFLEVDVTCPPSLLHPVLPSRSDDGRLLFDLLPKKNYVVCSVELKEALKHGYVVTAVYKTLHYERRGSSLCREYMLSFLKIKQESSGWAGKMLDGRQVESEEEKDEWIAKYHREEGVLLEKEKVISNPGLRAIAKLCMNSLWGKLGQKPVSRTVTYCDNLPEVYSILQNYQVHEILSTDARNSDATGTIHELIHDRDKIGAEKKPSFGANAGFAAFTTTYARLTLYEALHTVGDRAIYCDTDSLIYEYSPELPHIALGDKLGEWTDECGGDDIEEFIGVGPKTYAYRTKSGKFEVKCKGFKITSNNAHVLSFDNFKKAMLWGTGQEVDFAGVTVRSQIVRDKRSKTLRTDFHATKKLKPTFMNKGEFDVQSGRLLPFGFKK